MMGLQIPHQAIDCCMHDFSCRTALDCRYSLVHRAAIQSLSWRWPRISRGLRFEMCSPQNHSALMASMLRLTSTSAASDGCKLSPPARLSSCVVFWRLLRDVSDIGMFRTISVQGVRYQSPQMTLFCSPQGTRDAYPLPYATEKLSNDSSNPEGVTG